jgi:hypothetical protein
VDRRNRAERARYEAGLRNAPAAVRQRMTEAVLRHADPNDKSEIFRQLGLKLTYHPGRRLVEAKIQPAEYGFFDSARGPRPRIGHGREIALTKAFALDGARYGGRSGLKWTTAGAVLDVAAVATVASCEHA